MSLSLPWSKKSWNDLVPVIRVNDPQVAALMAIDELELARSIDYEMSLVENGSAKKIKTLSDNIDAVRVEFRDEDYQGIGGLLRYAFDTTYGKFAPEEKAKTKYWNFLQPINQVREAIRHEDEISDLTFNYQPEERLALLRKEASKVLETTPASRKNFDGPAAQL